MKHMTIKYTTRILFLLVALFSSATSQMWAYDRLDPVNNITIIVDMTPNDKGGTITNVSGESDGQKVTLSITPPSGYTISKELITAVPIKDVSSVRSLLRAPSLMEDPLTITDEGDNKYSFVLTSVL
jgi:hypothetical protein